MTAKPLARTAEIKAMFTHRTGIEVHRNTLSDGLAEAGITRTRNLRTTAGKQAELER